MNSKNHQNFSAFSLVATNSYTLPGFGIEEGPVIFKYVSLFLSFITPYELPLDLLRNAINANLTLVDFTTKTIMIESGFITLMVLLLTLSLIPLGVTITWCCRRAQDREKRTRQEPVNPLSNLNNIGDIDRLQCQRKLSMTTLAIFLTVLMLCDLVLFITNSRLSSTIEMTPDVIQASIHDLGVFLKDTNLQIKRKLDNGFDVAIQNVTRDLDDVDLLLGDPIKMEISANTGIELAFDSLAGISSANMELINRIHLLQESIAKSLKISQEAAARMEELQIQLSVLQRQCTFRDRPLCDTLRIRSFEENGIIDALKTLQDDQSIFKMKYLGELEVGSSVKNLSAEVAISKSIFGNFPAEVKRDTVSSRNETMEQLEHIRYKTTTMGHMLTETLTSLVDNLGGTWESFEPFYKTIHAWSDTYWGFAWTTAMIVLWVLIFMLAAFFCSLCSSQIRAAVLMVTSICIISVGSLEIMFFGISSIALGGNAEVFICRPLYDNDNRYEILSKLFDKPGFLYSNEPETGIIGELLRPPGENKSIVNVTLSSVIRNCENNMASYKVFQLDAFVNMTQMADIKQYPKVNSAINSIHVSERSLLSLTQSIQTILATMLLTSNLNLTSYRTSISQPNPEKDLATFIDQMQRVALQIQDVATSSRMTTLGSRAKRLQASILQPLEQLRNEILYHLTALELQKDPWTRQVNQTLNHLRNIQEYLERTAAEICSNQTHLYISRLKSYLSANKDHMSWTLGDKTAQCRPIFEIFDANRIFFCRNGVDSINGLWLCTFICILIYSIGTPIALNLVKIHKRIQIASSSRSNTHLSTSDNLLISEQSNWNVSNIPRPPPQPNMTRQDSVRSVRWDAAEDMVFEEVDAPNPMMRDNLL